MPYNDNQRFYAALYWVDALAGGRAFTDDICKKYGKPFVPVTAPQQTRRDIDWGNFFGSHEEIKAITDLVESGVTREQCEAFFESMYSFLQNNGEKESDARDGKYIKLAISIGTMEDHVPFCDSIEYALIAAGLPREVLNRRYTGLLMHDDGSIFFLPDGSRYSHDMQELAYPGRPDTGYRNFPGIQFNDFPEVTAEVALEHRYRIIDLEAGKTYRAYYPLASGERGGYDFVAKEGEKFYIDNYSVDGKLELLNELTDEEILSGTHPQLSSGHRLNDYNAHEFEAGYIYESGTVAMATDDPRVVRIIQHPMRCLDVTEKMQINWGNNFQRLEPGDKLIFDETGKRLFSIKKQDIEDGFVRVMAPKTSHGRPKPPQP